MYKQIYTYSPPESRGAVALSDPKSPVLIKTQTRNTEQDDTNWFRYISQLTRYAYEQINEYMYTYICICMYVFIYVYQLHQCGEALERYQSRCHLIKTKHGTA